MTSRTTRLRALSIILLVVAAIAPATASSGENLAIRVLSNRADLISDGDAYVEIILPSGARAADLTVLDDERDVTPAFAARAGGRVTGLVTGLSLGPNVLTATLPDGSGARITITNHPRGGPILAGPQIQPWVCQDGAVDKQCNAPTTFEFMYAPAGIGGSGATVPGVGAGTSSWQPYDPEDPPPSDQVATTTTDEGRTVPYIIRVETGYMDRDQYAMAVLFDPAKPWKPWAPQEAWNHKLLITHGASFGIDHTTGTAPGVTDDAGLSRGFLVMSTALDNAGHNCNIVTQAESLIMAKEHVVDAYGEIRYTIGTGCSGGSLVQYQVANAYPGLYQGILPQCSFPDAWSTGQQLADYHFIRLYAEHPDKWASGITWDPVQLGAIEGHPNHVNSIILDELYFTVLGVPTNGCAGVTDEQRYNPDTNKKGVRCTLADYMINVFGPRPEDGFAGRPLDNVGVQYGLEAMLSGIISPAQFVDLNVKVGAADIDGNYIPGRDAADRPALANAYRSGAINQANNLDQVAIIDLRGPDPGAFHDAYRAWAVRARLDREHGTHENQVIWQGFAPIIGDTQYTEQGLVAIDRWLAAVEKDHSGTPLAKKLIQNRPADVHDQCSDGIGQVIAEPAGSQACAAIVQRYTTPRVVAGEPVSTDQNACQLKPLRREAYGTVAFTDVEWSALQKVFPTGVCDFTKPGIDQQPTIPWQTYEDAIGGRPLGPVPASTPIGGASVLGEKLGKPLPATGVGDARWMALGALGLALMLGATLSRRSSRG